MDPFHAGAIQQSRRIPHQQAPGKTGVGQCLQPPGHQNPGPGFQGASASEDGAQPGMGFPALQQSEGIGLRVAVGQMHHQTQIQASGSHVIKKSPPMTIRGQGPAQRMQDGSGFGLMGFDFPNFFETQGILLWCPVTIQLEMPDQPCGQMAACPFGNHGDGCQESHPGLEMPAGHTLGVPSDIRRDNPLKVPMVIPNGFHRWKTMKDLHPEVFGTTAESLAQGTKADDETPLIAHHVAMGQDVGLGATQKEQVFLSDRGGIRWDGMVPVGQQKIQTFRVHDSAGQDVGPGIRPFVQEANRALLTLTAEKFRQVNGRCQPRRTGTDNNDIKREFFLIHGRKDVSLLADEWQIKYAGGTYKGE